MIQKRRPIPGVPLLFVPGSTYLPLTAGLCQDIGMGFSDKNAVADHVLIKG